jgi:phosphatidylserine decarboxylase
VHHSSAFYSHSSLIRSHWAEEFLTKPESTYVFHKTDTSATPKVYGWLSSPAKEEMAQIAMDASGRGDTMTFEEIFECEKEDPNLGFKSWDDFFTRLFRPGVRPVEDPNDPNVIVNACESEALQLVKNVKFNDKFWVKEQPYSLQDMLDSHPLAEEFIGGTVYQAFLSALSYHRWNSPVDGVVEDVYTIDGSYFLENREETSDSAAPDAVQPFLTSVASRAVIFIRANSDAIGLMCFVAVGMAEVSTCEITVKKGDVIKKGDQLGMFHFGGSTHCLLFRKDVNVKFIDVIADPKKIDEHGKNIAVLSKIAWVE